MEDFLTTDTVHRELIEQEDEERAQELAPQYAAEPAIQWAGEGPVADAKPIVVFLVGQAACLLAGTLLHNTQPLGVITVPELVRVRSALEEEYTHGTGHQPQHRCTISGDGQALLLVQCPLELPQEQASIWAKHVLAALQPKAAVVAATFPAMSYRGPGSPADDDLIFSLQTAAAEAASATSASVRGSATGSLPPSLPGATMLGGLPAALLSWCEVRQVSAVLVTGVQQQQVPDAQFLMQLGLGTAAALKYVAGDATAATVVKPQPRPQLLASLAAAADNMYRSSASCSIFS